MSLKNILLSSSLLKHHSEAIQLTQPRDTLNFGILGCGHLGSVIAQSLIKNGLCSSKSLKIAIKGNEKTKARIIDKGWQKYLSDPTSIALWADICLITVRPQQAYFLSDCFASNKGMLISFMAGWTLKDLRTSFGKAFIRMMPSSPESINQGKGIVAVYPYTDELKTLMEAIGFKVIKAKDERFLDLFTVSVSLPAILMEKPMLVSSRTIEMMKERFGYSQNYWEMLFKWIEEVIPPNLNQQERLSYIEGMATPGGITETMLKAVRKDVSLEDAFALGLKRCQSIIN